MIDRADGHHSPGFLSDKGFEVGYGLGFIGPNNQAFKIDFFLFPLFFFLVIMQVRIDPDIILAFVFSQIKDFKGAKVLPGLLELSLDTDHPFSGGMNGEFAEIGPDPLAVQLFCHRQGRAGSAEEVGNQIARIGRGFDDPL